MAKRLVPRFTLRTLAIFVMLICAYMATWEATKKYGLEPNGYVIFDREWSPMPLIVCSELDEYRKTRQPSWRTHRTFHIWFFGHRIKTSLETIDVWTNGQTVPLI